MAAGGPKPIVANPPGVSTLPGVYTGNCWPTPFLFQPTSVVMIASRGNCARTSARMRSGIIGNASDVAMAWLLAMKSRRNFAMVSADLCRLASVPDTFRARPASRTCSACLRSATAPISVEKFLPISDGLDVDVDEARRRNVERVVAIPGAAVGFLESRAEAQHPVGGEAGVVHELRAPEPAHAEQQRVIVGQRALAHEAVRNGNSEVIDERAQFVAGIRQHDAAADVHQGLLRLRHSR